MSGLWKPITFGEYTFVCRYQCHNRVVFKLSSPSAREVLRRGDQEGFERMRGLCMQHWFKFGRRPEYKPSVPGTWV